MFSKSTDLKSTFLEQTKCARESRALEKKKDDAATIIQASVRSWLARTKFINKVLEDFDENIPEIAIDGEVPVFKPAIEIYHYSRRFLFIWKKERDKEKFERLCNYIVYSLESDAPKISFVGIALIKEHVINWIPHMNAILWKCCEYLDDLKPEYAEDMKSIVLLLRVLVSFTSTSSWMILKNKSMESLRTGLNQLCMNMMGQLVQKGFYGIFKKLLIKGLGRPKIYFKHITLSATLTLTLRPLIAANFSEKLLTKFLVEVLSVPALVRHLETTSPESITLLTNHKILPKSLELLSLQQSIKIIFNTLEGNYALCLLANLLHLAFIERETTLQEFSFPLFTMVVSNILQSCQNYVISKQSNLTHWNPVLGWFAQPLDEPLQASMPHVINQLNYLWSSQMIKILLGDYLSKATCNIEIQRSLKVESNIIFKRAFDFQSHKGLSKKSFRNFDNPEVHRIVVICSMYHMALKTMTQLRLDILTGLCYQNNVLYNMWLFLCSLGPNCGTRMFLDHLSVNKNDKTPECQMLQLFCDCMSHYITILDDLEMYEQQEPFTLSDFTYLSGFLNIFLYQAITGNLFDLKTIQNNSFFQSVHALLIILYRRNCRRPYTPQGHWLIKELKSSTFLSDLDKGRQSAQLLLKYMPHVILHEDRVRLFRKYIKNEKTNLGVSESAHSSTHSTVITIHRSRIVEDGYRQLALLPSQAVKGVIRVRFINEQGLDEAGIDQDGVFKEFLEESLKLVFNPSLNLFKVTSEERLYPSPTSYLQENHLQLFEFVGRMLGKAIYEGIVIDVPFASFFLSQVLGQTSQASYSCIDELPSLDTDLYKSLNYIKHYEGDISDLNLTFSLDEDILGKLVTYELVPGGKAVPVTNTNKINYIHLMAHFRMHIQIKEQTSAFIKGFRSIINPEWLSLFSTPELQRLISGDNVPLDLRDLRKHTQYFGGFHDSHKVIGWLWDVLEKEFSEKEKALFLKFVTSCSKPPLLGFAHLEPPFSIRCIEVGDDEDTGDTVGSVFRGFFTIRKKDPQNRLPTSSTCFNLLKLPNYQKKSTLREKLRYAVTSNTGFELS